MKTLLYGLEHAAGLGCHRRDAGCVPGAMAKRSAAMLAAMEAHARAFGLGMPRDRLDINRMNVWVS